MAKFQVSMDDELLARIDSFAKRNYTTRSGAISFACLQAVRADELIALTDNLCQVMQKLSESKEIDEESKAQLDQLEVLVKMLTMKQNSSENDA